MFAVGDKLGAYTIQRRIGAGGMGAVYLAEHLHIGRKAAIKVLLAELSSRPDIVARFFNEARATGLLKHPGIVEILDCDVHSSGRAYIVMEFLEGETLGASLERIGSFEEEPTSAAAIAGQIAAALTAAHGKGIVHRDLKPDNIFLTSTPDEETPIRVKILDFGIAKLFGDGSAEGRKTRTGSLLGTPLYMSPEQCRGAGQIDHRSDIYSLGCIIFELLSGRPPFVREGHGELIIAHNSEPPPELASLVPSVAPALAGLVARMLAKDVAQRPQAMADVVRELEDLLGVPSSQFVRLVKVPEGFPVHGAGEDLPEPRQGDPLDTTGRALATVEVPDPVTRPVSPPPSALPRTVVRAGYTKILPESNTTLSQAAAPGPDRPARASSRIALKVGIAVGALALGGLALFVLWPATQASKETSSTAAPSTAWMPGPAAQAAVPTMAIEAPAREAPTATPKVVTIDLEKAPDGLVVRLDGQPATVPVTVPFGDATHELRLEAPGFKGEILRVDGRRDKTIVLNMQAMPPPPVKAKRREPRPRKRNEGFDDL